MPQLKNKDLGRVWQEGCYQTKLKKCHLIPIQELQKVTTVHKGTLFITDTVVIVHAQKLLVSLGLALGQRRCTATFVPPRQSLSHFFFGWTIHSCKLIEGIKGQICWYIVAPLRLLCWHKGATRSPCCRPGEFPWCCQPCANPCRSPWCRRCVRWMLDEGIGMAWVFLLFSNSQLTELPIAATGNRAQIGALQRLL